MTRGDHKFGWSLPPGVTMKDIEDQFAEPEMPRDVSNLFDAFIEATNVETIRARTMFPPFHSRHEGYAVILEEVRELEHFVFSPHDQMLDASILIKECIQISAMCFCMIAECIPNLTSDNIMEA